MGKKVSLVGEVFGRLTVVEEAKEKTNENKYQYWCKCSCGNTELVLKRASSLRKGDSRSCGCLQKENAKLQSVNNTGVARSHGMTNTPTYICWRNMKARCDDENHPAFVNYGARGVSYPAEWVAFECFLDDMGEQPEGLTLNRIDVNEDYSKDNCEWVGLDKQSRDRRKPKSGVTSPYKGVSFNTAEGKYKAALGFEGTYYHLGYSDDPLVLALRYDEKVRELTGGDFGTNKQLGLLPQ